MTNTETTTETKVKLGRKPIQDKKKPITIYRAQSEIDALGGLANVRKALNDIFTQQFSQSKQTP